MSTAPIDDLPTARLVLRLFRAFEADLVKALEAQGITGVTLSGLTVLRPVETGGIGLSRLAADAGLTKQSVGKLVQEQQRKGYLRVAPDPVDGRAKTVMFTAKGQRMVEVSLATIQRFEARYREALGERRYRDFRRCLAILSDLHSDTNMNDGPSGEAKNGTRKPAGVC